MPPPNCKHCGKPFIRFPLWEGEPFKSKFIPRNLFRMDLVSFLMIIAIIIMLTGYKHDIEKCNKVMEGPCNYCEEIGCCSLIQRRNNQENLIDYDVDNIITDYDVS